MKILTIIGARPQFVKASVVSASIKEGSKFEEVIVHTGQHFDKNMSEIFFDELGLPQPNYNLKINGGNHGEMTGRMLVSIEEVVLKERPNLLLVYGDTNSTLAGALAASKLHIPIAHIEAGLRSYNFLMPEEQNRILTDRLSKYLFCPTNAAEDNLKREGFPFASQNQQIEMVGDVMEDAANFFFELSKDRKSRHGVSTEILSKDYILATIHRAENTNDSKKLKQIVENINYLSQFELVIIPLHPRTKNMIQDLNLKFSDNVFVIEPVGYLDMIQLISNSSLVITDSGGLQKEAYFFNKFCITLREQTEWIELVQNGYNELVGSDYDLLKHAYINFKGKVFSKDVSLYGGGTASGKIVNILIDSMV
jgi:UDP-GlcNAc3NAcA epimerase